MNEDFSHWGKLEEPPTNSELLCQSLASALNRIAELKLLCSRSAEALEEDQPMVIEPICDLGAARNRQALITELREAAK